MPAWIAVRLSRVRGAVLGDRLNADFDREIGEHLDSLTDEHVRRGLPPEEARRLAVLRFGGRVQLIEQQQASRGLPFVDTAKQDARYAIRALRRNPGFALAAILTLGLGVGATTTMFSVVQAVLWRPLPYAHPEQLVRIYENNPLKRWTKNVVAPANYADWKRQSTSFDGIAAYEGFGKEGSQTTNVYLTGSGEPQAIKTVSASGNLMRLLGAEPLLGRSFTDEETFEGRERVVVLSHGLWRSQFGGDPGVIGRTIVLSGRTYDIVGVMPASFAFPGRDVQLWMPLGYSADTFTTARRPHWLNVIARLRPGVPMERARDDMNGVAARLASLFPDTNTQMGVELESFHDSLSGDQRPALEMLLAAVGVLFLIVCANIANLQFGRAVARAREMAIRHAIGAGRGRLVRQLLTESLVLSVLGGGCGLIVALIARGALERWAADALPLFADVRVDRAELLFIVVLCLVAPIVFGLMPALSASRPDRLNDRGDAGPRSRSRDVLVAAEVGLSVVLVVGAVLLGRSLLRLQDVDPGFRPERVVTFTLALPSARYPDNGKRFVAVDAIQKRLAEGRRVQAVGVVSILALRGTTWTGDATVEGRAPTDFERELRHESISPGYFSAIGARLIAGRMIDEHDTRDTPPVAIVNATLAARYFRGESAVGRRITFGRPRDSAPWVTIVGVVADQKQDGIDKPVEPEEYSPIAQRMQNPLTFAIRTSEDTEAAIAAAGVAVRSVDKDVVLTDVSTLTEVVQKSIGRQRFRTTLLASFAVVALLLAAIGIYGVLAYFVTQRGRELGVRLALGARPRELFFLVVGQGLRPVVAGVVAGLVAAAALTGLMKSLLFGIQPMDAPTYLVTAGTLALVAVAACALPALRATRVDPMVALRQE